MTLENIIREGKISWWIKRVWKQPLLHKEPRAVEEIKVKAEKRETANFVCVCLCVCSGRHDRDMHIYVTVCRKTRTDVHSGNIRLQHQPRACWFSSHPGPDPPDLWHSGTTPLPGIRWREGPFVNGSPATERAWTGNEHCAGETELEQGNFLASSCL